MSLKPFTAAFSPPNSLGIRSSVQEAGPSRWCEEAVVKQAAAQRVHAQQGTWCRLLFITMAEVLWLACVVRESKVIVVGGGSRLMLRLIP